MANSASESFTCTPRFSCCGSAGVEVKIPPLKGFLTALLQKGTAVSLQLGKQPRLPSTAFAHVKETGISLPPLPDSPLYLLHHQVL